MAHGITAQAYRDMHGLPRTAKLTADQARENWAAKATELHARGVLPSGSEAMAAVSRKRKPGLTKAMRDEIKAIGLRAMGKPIIISRDMIQHVLDEVTAGTPRYKAIKATGMSDTGFRSALARHPDLLAKWRSLSPRIWPARPRSPAPSRAR